MGARTSCAELAIRPIPGHDVLELAGDWGRETGEDKLLREVLTEQLEDRSFYGGSS